MLLAKSVRGVSAGVLALLTGSCGSQSPTQPSVPKTYQSVYINAYWTGGRTGSPNDSLALGPGSFSGSYCPASSLILDNHGTRYQGVFSNSQTVLVFKNTCTASANLLVCVSAGSGGNFSEFPICNADPRTTPINRLASVNMGPNESGLQSTTWRTTGVNLDLNIFYCGIGDSFALGAVPGANPTDCMN
jgi:hypothetical protein